MGRSRVWFEAGLVGVLGVAVFGSTMAVMRRGGEYAFLDPLIEVKQAVSTGYVDELTPDTLRAMQSGAIRGMLEALNDPYTEYVPPADTLEFNKDLTGEYVGIGAQVQVIDGVLTIVSPLEDSPAFRIGLMADDKVLEIDGKTTTGLTVEECVRRLVGEKGTPVTLLIERNGQKQTYEIRRDAIKTQSVKGFHRDEANPEKWMHVIDPARKIAYIRITQFTPRVSVEVAEALRRAVESAGGLGGLILDVRYNGGGLLDEAVAISDMFLESGTIVSTKGRRLAGRSIDARKANTLPDFPLVILVNGQSASASEILAGALVENNRAIVLGTRTFGKGSVQSVHEISVTDPDGTVKSAELKLTEQGYYLPSGRSLSRKDGSTQWGVDPSPGFFLPMTDEEVIEMLRVRREEEILRNGNGAAPADANWSDPDWALDRLKDPQLAAAVRAIRERIASGEWKPVGGDQVSPDAAAVNEIVRLRQARERLMLDLMRIERRTDALETALGDKTPEVKDFWADSVDVSGGTLRVLDREGKLVAELEITANTLEAWLLNADVKKPVETK